MGRKRKEEENLEDESVIIEWEKFPITLSSTMKTALGSFATTAKLSMAEVVRQAVANHIGYDLTTEPKKERKTKYESVEERKEAQRSRYKERSELIRKLKLAQLRKDK